MEVNVSGEKLGLILRIGLFVFLAIFGLSLFPALLLPVSGLLVAAALSTFAAAAIANSVVLRIFERAQLADIGLNWHQGAPRNLGVGLACGVGAALVVLGPPLLLGFARLEPTPDQPGSPAAALFIALVLLFGAVGEEMLFRGYVFQLLMANIGRFGTILPMSVVFGLAHSGNQSVTPLAMVNTVGFGFLLGYAYTLTGDLWLPIGLHFGWNWTLPLFGLNLSGFTMGVTGVQMRWSVPSIWSGGDYGPEGGVLTTFIIVALFFVLQRAPVFTQVPYLIAKQIPEQ